MDWVVTVANQTSVTPSTSFDVPVIANVSAVWGDRSAALRSQLQTSGGQQLDICGVNLGPAAPNQYVTSATMGPYALLACNVTTAHTCIRCVTPAGVGSNYRLAVMIGDQLSEPSEDVISYAPPSLLSLTPGLVPTSGAVVVANGTNLGPTSQSSLSILANGVALPQLVSILPPGHTALSFSTGDVSGVSSVAVVVDVGGQRSAPIQLHVAPPTITSYAMLDMLAMSAVAQQAEPCFAAVRGDANADVVVLTGTNFGTLASAISISFALLGVSSNYSCSPCGAVTHTQVKCPVPVAIDRSMSATLTVALPSGSASVVYKYIGRSTSPAFLTTGLGFEAVNSGGQVGIGAGDTVVLRFNQVVNNATVPVGTKAQVDALLTFSHPIGTDYSGAWSLDGGSSVLTLTIRTPTANASTSAYRAATRVGGSLRVTVLASARLLVADLSGQPCNDTITLTAGTWGDVVCAVSVQSKSWRQLLVSWERPRTVLASYYPRYDQRV